MGHNKVVKKSSYTKKLSSFHYRNRGNEMKRKEKNYEKFLRACHWFSLVLCANADSLVGDFLSSSLLLEYLKLEGFPFVLLQRRYWLHQRTARLKVHPHGFTFLYVRLCHAFKLIRLHWYFPCHERADDDAIDFGIVQM